jgi:hypothetical protein
MLTSVLLALAFAALDEKSGDPSKKETPAAKKELFAKEGWYRDQEGKEQDFVGVLEKSKNAGRIGFGRNNPYRLVMKGDVREVYIGGKPQILAEYVGKTIKLTGKAVDIGVEGKRHREIWPARLEVVAAPRKDGFAPRGTAADERLVLADDATKNRELRVQGRGFWRASAKPGAAAQQLVIRSGAEAAKASGLPADGKGQQQATEMLAKALKVEKIDWDKQMVIVVTAGAKPTGGYRVEVQNVAIKDGALKVRWKLHTPTGFVTQAFTHPAESVLVEKFEGKVTFEAAPKTDKKDK